MDRGVRLSLGGTIYDPTDPLGKMFFNILATFAEFEAGLLRLRTREGMPSPARRASRAASSRHTTAATELVRMHNTGEYSKADLASCSPSPEPPCTGSSNATAPPQPEQARNSNRCFCAGSYGDPGCRTVYVPMGS